MDKSKVSDRFKRIKDRATQKAKRYEAKDRAEYAIEAEVASYARIYGDAANRSSLASAWEMVGDQHRKAVRRSR